MAQRIACDFSRAYANLWQGERGAVLGFIGFAVIFLFAGGWIFSFAIGTTLVAREFGAGLLSALFG